MAEKLVQLRDKLVLPPVRIWWYRKVPESPGTEPFYGETLQPREHFYAPPVEVPVHRDRNATIQMNDLAGERLGYVADAHKCGAFPFQVLLERVSIHGLLLCGLFVS